MIINMFLYAIMSAGWFVFSTDINRLRLIMCFTYRTVYIKNSLECTLILLFIFS